MNTLKKSITIVALVFGFAAMGQAQNSTAPKTSETTTTKTSVKTAKSGKTAKNFAPDRANDSKPKDTNSSNDKGGTSNTAPKPNNETIKEDK